MLLYLMYCVQYEALLAFRTALLQVPLDRIAERTRAFQQIEILTHEVHAKPSLAMANGNA